MQTNFNSGLEDQYTYAGFFVRLSAYIFDLVTLFVITLIIRLITGFSFFGREVLFSFTLRDIIMYLCHVSYFILFTYMTRTTPGKRIMNIMVICDDDQSTMNLKDIIFRETVGKYLSAIIMNVGFILIGLDNEKRGLHDILSDTHVVYAEKVKSYSQSQHQHVDTEYHLIEPHHTNTEPDFKYDDINI